MLTEEQENVIGEALVPLFDYLEQYVINDIARRVDKTLTYTRTAELYAMQMRKFGYSPAKIRAEVMKRLYADKDFIKMVDQNTIEYKKEIKELIKAIEEEARARGDELVANAGDMSWIDDLRVWESNGITLADDGYLSTLVSTYQSRIADGIVNLTRSTGFALASGTVTTADAYRSELNKALIKISTGTSSSEEAVKECIKSLAKGGLKNVDYASGRTMNLGSAVRVAVRTGVHQMSGELSRDNIEKTDTEFVYVSAHEGARNTGTGHANHEEWQGKVYTVGTVAKERVEAEAKRIGQTKIEDCYEATGYSVDGTQPNDPLGLYGYNCRHRIHPHFEGVSSIPVPFQPRPDVEWQGRKYDYYAQTQRARKYERDIRNLKRESVAMKRFGEDANAIDARISNMGREYREFCDLCEMRTHPEALSYEAETMDLTKTQAWKRAQINS